MSKAETGRLCVGVDLHKTQFTVCALNEEGELSQRAKTDKTARHQNKSFTHKEKPDRMITRSGRGTGQTNNARSLANAIGA